MWSGIIEIEPTLTDFALCLGELEKPEEVIRWTELPSFLNILDGGYRKLLPEEARKLVEDMVEFHEVAAAKIHLRDTTTPCKLTNQDDLKELSEILVQWQGPAAPVEQNQAMLVEVELFETTFLLIAHCLEFDSESLVLSLTEHFYWHHRRQGRRVKANGFCDEGCRILELSDFGAQVEWHNESPPNVGTQVDLSIFRNQFTFNVAYARLQQGCTLVGLSIFFESNEQRNNWHQYLIQFQYPLLSIRTERDHEETWKLFEKSGYLQSALGPVLRESRDQIFKEWTYLDRAGSAIGTTVIGRHAGEAIATIGVARAAGGAWIAQAAAMIDDPKYMEFTRSVYGWRTRALLQQPDAQFHVAYFEAGKAFLDRFFRKFFLQLTEIDRPHVTWEEWQSYFLRKPERKTGKQSKGLGQRSSLPSRLLEILHDDRETNLFLQEHADTVIVNGRPYQHFAQFLASAWIVPGQDFDLDEIENAFAEREHPFATLLVLDRSIEDRFSSEISSGKIRVMGRMVVWTCHRFLLPRFLGNSLRSLELMSRKYGPRSVA